MPCCPDWVGYHCCRLVRVTSLTLSWLQDDLALAPIQPRPSFGCTAWPLLPPPSLSSRAALISIHQQLMEGQTDSFLPGPVSSSWSSLTHLPLLYLPPYRQLLSSLVSRHCPLACTTSACVRVWLWAARVGVMSANAHPPYPRCSMSEHVSGSGSWTWCGRCHPGIYAFSEGTLGRRHSAVLKSKVTLPSHLLCHLLYGAEMLGVQRQKGDWLCP